MNIQFMKDDHESNTAAYMALFRAVESARPEEHRLFSDPLAASLLPTSLRLVAKIAHVPAIGRMVPAILDVGWPRTRSSGVVRTRLIDAMVEEAIIDGAAQFVLLGAGLDSRAYRLQQARGIAVFEVDHPSTQRAKLRRLQVSGESVDHVHFVSVDFEIDDVARRLEDAGFDKRVRSMVVWEGVVSYLSPRAVDDNFALLAGICSPGSRLVFTYVDGRALDGSMHFKEATRWKGWVRLNGEPFVFGFHPDELEAYLSERGFHLDSERTTAEAARRFNAELGRTELGSELYRVAEATRVAPCPE
jgi:methyltransferase (TIGR00027 family)